MKAVMNSFAFVLLLISIGVCNCIFELRGSDYPFDSDEICGDEQFGLTHGGGKSLEADCGRHGTFMRRDLQNICIANLYRPSSLPSIIDDTNNIGYHTVFEFALRDNMNNIVTRKAIRFNAEYEISSSSDKYIVTIPQVALERICTKYGSANCNSRTGVSTIDLYVDAYFFTDFRLRVNDDQTTADTCGNPDCGSSLCMYFVSATPYLCTEEFGGYFAIRVKPYGTTNVYKTVKVDVKLKGSFTKGSESNDWFYIHYKHLQPLLEAAKCSTYCTDNDTGKTYCEVGNSCGAGTTSTTYSSGSYPPGLIGDYTVVRVGPIVPDGNNHCEVLQDNEFTASRYVVFDERMGGKPRCQCFYGSGWNPTIQKCEKCDGGSSLVGCPDPCHNKCEWNEYCTVDSNGIAKCVCKEGHTLLSKDGQCKEMLNCDNGTVIMSNGEWSCQCDDGYFKIRENGPCLVDASVICFDNFPECIIDNDNDTACICPNDSVIQIGMCATDCSDCGTHEECSIDGSGRINCTCIDDYTRIFSTDSCFHTLSCPLPKETLRMTEDMDFICTCKEGYIRLNDPDEIVCLDYSNMKFSCLFCVLWLIVVMAVN